VRFPVLPLLLLLSPLTVACYDDTVDPTVSDDTLLSATAKEHPKCWKHGGYLAIAGEPRDFDGTIRTTTSTCTCQYTKNHDALGCRTDAFCESSYDIGADNPKTCTYEDSYPAIDAITATADREDCSVTVTPGTPGTGTFTGTLTCASEGPVAVRVVVTAAEVPRATYIDFSVLAVDAPCEDAGR
jgi:hypothetical protein